MYFHLGSKNVIIRVGTYTHNGIALLVDDVKITQRTTSPPTPFPTFSPTKSKNNGPTIQPTIRTEAPTTANVLMCPKVGEPPIVVPSGSVMLPIIVDSTLCTLTKVLPSSASEIISIPIARSYANHRWEKSAGEYAASLFGDDEILCYNVGCQIELPIPIEAGAVFRLQRFSHSVSEVDELARFLESATFGITQQQLNEFDASSNHVRTDIIDWVAHQMNNSATPMTSHREFWRKGLNQRVSLPNNR